MFWADDEANFARGARYARYDVGTGTATDTADPGCPERLDDGPVPSDDLDDLDQRGLR